MSSAGAASLEKIKTSIGPVLADAKGLTLYWYAKDTAMSSACTGSCATAWPPLTGKPAAAMGFRLVGKFGTITRANGVMQATYKGHPLYTYAGDMAPGQVKGNGLGGVWHALKVTAVSAVSPGAMMSSSSPTPSASTSSSSSGGGGYGGGGVLNRPRPGPGCPGSVSPGGRPPPAAPARTRLRRASPPGPAGPLTCPGGGGRRRGSGGLAEQIVIDAGQVRAHRLGGAVAVPGPQRGDECGVIGLVFLAALA